MLSSNGPPPRQSRGGAPRLAPLGSPSRPRKLAHDINRAAMPKLTVTQAHSLPLEQVKQRLQMLADRLGAKYGISARWTSDTQAAISRIGVTGTISIEPAAATVAVDLSFVLTALQDRVC